MKNFLIFAILSLGVLVSCEQDDLTLKMNTDSGELSVALKDNGGAPIAGVQLSLFTNIKYNNRTKEHDKLAIDEQISDANGQVNFGQLMPGTYIIYARNVKDGDYSYNITQSAHVISSEATNLSIVPSEYSATIVFTIAEKTKDNVQIPLGSDVTVALVKMPYLTSNSYYAPSLEDTKDYIVQEFKADGKTKVFTFENIPLDEYMILAYTSADYMQFWEPDEIEEMQKDCTYEVNEVVRLSQIRMVEYDTEFIVEQEVPNAALGITEILPYEGCQAFVLKHFDYHSLDDKHNIEAVKAVAHSAGVTNAEGKTIMKIIDRKRIAIVYFAPDNTYIGEKNMTRFGNSSSPIKFLKK